MSWEVQFYFNIRECVDLHHEPISKLSLTLHSTMIDYWSSARRLRIDSSIIFAKYTQVISFSSYFSITILQKTCIDSLGLPSLQTSVANLYWVFQLHSWLTAFYFRVKEFWSIPEKVVYFFAWNLNFLWANRYS